MIIPKNTSVLVKRVPVIGRAGVSSKFNARAPLNQLPPAGGVSSLGQAANFGPVSSGRPAVIAAVSGNSGSEDQRIQSMMQESSQVWDRNQTNTALSQASLASRRTFRPRHSHLAPTIPVHPNYICFRCGQKGVHHISVCPTNGDPIYDRPRLKKTTGIPRAFLRPTTFDPQQQEDAQSNNAATAAATAAAGAGAVMVTAEGSFVVAQANDAEWNRLASLRSALPLSASIPAHQQCPLCHGWLQEPALTRCCSAACCEDCLVQLVAEQGEAARCPSCRRPLAPDAWTAAPNAQSDASSNKIASTTTTNANAVDTVKLKEGDVAIGAERREDRSSSHREYHRRPDRSNHQQDDRHKRRERSPSPRHRSRR